MVFKKERVQVICDQLLKLSYVQRVEIVDWYMKKGAYYTIEEVDNNPQPWEKFDGKTIVCTGQDEHYWLRTTVTVPEGFDERPLSLMFNTQSSGWDNINNPQLLAFIDGEITQGLDINHRDIYITASAKAGREYTIDLQAYTGSPHSNFTLIGEMVEIDDRLLKLYYDLQVPILIAEELKEDDLTRISLIQVLNDTVNLLDLREPYSSEFYASVDEAVQHISKVIYEELAGFDDIVATCIGHTHIDVAYRWTVAQTREKVARSFATVVKYMDEFPEYIFMASQPQLYKFIKERYPHMYGTIKERIKEGRWEPEGGMFVEADCNVTSGESLVRQFLYGKKFFKDEFGVDSVILWLPDVFGYSAALPQIMVKSGIKYFMTTKISWNEFNKLPYDTFFWRGIDGTEIFTHLITTRDINHDADSVFTTYNGVLHPNALVGGWRRYQQKALNNDILISYGYGDGGGGPTREMLEIGKRMQKGIKGGPKVRFDTSRKYFDELYERCAKNPKLPKWVGELYLEYHRGTYTSMARNKRSNRKAELGLQDLEFLSVWAESIGIEYPEKEIHDIWEVVLLNQFHDILPGTSIKEVYEVTKKEYTEIEAKIKELTFERLQALGSCMEGDIILFNTLSFTRDDIVIIECEEIDASALVDEKDNIIPLQKTFDNKLIAYVQGVPAKGYKTYSIDKEKHEIDEVFNIAETGIETPFYKIGIDSQGIFTSIYDKKNFREVLRGNGNQLKVYEDKPMNYDNWNIEIYHTEKGYPVDEVQRCEWIERGPVRATLLIEKSFSKSYISQKIHFYANTGRIDFETYVDWRQHQHLLKVEFPVDVNADEATYDIQFGNVRRPTHKNTSWDMAKFEVCGHKWADLSEGDYGMSILNDCKYGHSIQDYNMALTLIKSGIEPHPTTDQEQHFFTYSILPHTGDWKEAKTVEQAYMLNVPLYAIEGEGGRAEEQGLIDVYANNVILEIVKRAEDGQGIVIRLYEYKNNRSDVTVELRKAPKTVYECSLMEEVINEMPIDNTKLGFQIKPFEIKTFKLIY